jgi:CPA1 family monovalent cation:H+ antiporter
VNQPDVVLLLGLLIVVSTVAAAVRLIRIPYTVALVLTGAVLALVPQVPHVQVTPGIILTVFLPVLLFYGSYKLDTAELRADALAVTILALPGVVVTAGLVGLTLHVTTGIPWSEAFVFGSIVAATDPVAVLALFGDLGAPRRLTALVSGESLFNDGAALVLFATLLTVAAHGSVDGGETLVRVVIEVVGALALGAAVGLLGSAAVHGVDDPLLETTMTLIMAYGGYLLADRIGSSGPLETVAAGLVLGVRGRHVMSDETRRQAHIIWDFIDFLANSLIFLLMGLALRPIAENTLSRLGWSAWWPLVVAVFAVTATRMIVVWGVGALLSHTRRPLPAGWRRVLTWAGLRGAVSFAAALSLPANLPDRDLLLTLTFGVVFFTLVVQGVTLRSLLDHLGLSETSPLD